jgi:hypothetical protein
VDDDHDLEVIRHQMEETRSSLADKLETLETQLGETVEVATEAVSSTVETVQETVETVKETLDLRIQVERHPWLMMTGAVAAGYIAGCMLDSSPTRQASPPRPTLEQWAAPRPSSPAPAPAPTPAKKEGLFDSSIEKLKGLAIGSLMSIVRELVTQIAPANLTTDLASVVDDLTTRLGGKPLRSVPRSTQPESNPKEESPPEAATPATTGSTEAPQTRPKPNGRGKRRPARI